MRIFLLTSSGLLLNLFVSGEKVKWKNAKGENMSTTRYESVDAVKFGDVVEYAPQQPYAPWTLLHCIGAVGHVYGFHADCAVVKLRHGGHITACYANLVRIGTN